MEPLPAAAESVAAYVAERAEDRSLSTVRLDRYAIRWAHDRAGHPSPTGHPGVRRVVKGLRRTAAREGRAASRQAAALTASGLAAIAERRRDRADRTDGIAGARPSAGVPWTWPCAPSCVTPCSGARKRPRSPGPTSSSGGDGSARVTVRRSKTDQEARGPCSTPGRPPRRPCKPIRLREPFAGAARVFGLASGRAVSNRIAAAAKAAGLDGHYSGHSPRIGMAVDLVRAGIPTASVQVAGRWASDRMPAYYTRGETASRGAVAAFYGR